MTDLNASTARQLASLGLFVFPCNPDKRPVSGLKWREASSNDPIVISGMWAEHPNAVPAIDCGKSGIVVADLDRHEANKDGCAAFAALEAKHGRLDNAPRIQTPGRGTHIYMKQPEGEPLGNSTGLLPAGIDVRGNGGFVIAAGAALPDGRRYEIDARFPRLSVILSNGGLPPPPQWFVDIIRAQPVERMSCAVPYSSDSSDEERRFVEAALACVPADDRDLWLKFGGALHDTGHPWCRAVWDSWSRRSSKFDAVGQNDAWKSFGRQTGRKATVGSIVEEARLRGFQGHKHRASGQERIQATTQANTPPDWRKPKALPQGLRPVVPFDIRFLPQSLAPWVGDIVDRMQCPPDFVGISAIIAMGATIGRKVGVRPQVNTPWVEVSNLWGMCIGRPGLLKSPAMDEALKPLKRLEMNAKNAFDDDMRAFGIAAAAHKIVLAEAQSKASVAAKKGGDVVGILSSVEAPENPKQKRYIVNDSSYERLGELLADNPNGVLLFRDELVSLLRTLDREDAAAARGFYLSAWNGTSGYTFDRITRGCTHIEAACLSLLGSTQPGRISEYIRRATNGGAGDDGLIQRFGLLVWPDTSTWKEVDRLPDTAAQHRAWNTFDHLDNLSPGEVGATVDEFNALPYLRFDAEAGDIFRGWREDLERRLHSDELTPSLESHLAKYRKLVPALALINHLADGGVGAIAAGSVLKALACAEYLETHARRAYGAGLEIETAAAKAILKHVRKGDLQDGFTQRDIHQRDWSNLTDSNHVKAGLDLLCDLDWLMSKTDATGGRPRTTYTINPMGVGHE